MSQADMSTSADDRTLAYLLASKQAGLLTRAAELRAEAVRLEEAASGIAAALRFIDPATAANIDAIGRGGSGGVRVSRVSSGSSSRFGKGECLALVQDALREAARPLTTTELVRCVLEKKGLPPSEEDSVRLALRYALGKGAKGDTGVAQANSPGGYPRWTLKVEQAD